MNLKKYPSLRDNLADMLEYSKYDTAIHIPVEKVELFAKTVVDRQRELVEMAANLREISDKPRCPVYSSFSKEDLSALQAAYAKVDELFTKAIDRDDVYPTEYNPSKPCNVRGQMNNKALRAVGITEAAYPKLGPALTLSRKNLKMVGFVTTYQNGTAEIEAGACTDINGPLQKFFFKRLDDYGPDYQERLAELPEKLTFGRIPPDPRTGASKTSYIGDIFSQLAYSEFRTYAPFQFRGLIMGSDDKFHPIPRTPAPPYSQTINYEGPDVIGYQVCALPAGFIGDDNDQSYWFGWLMCENKEDIDVKQLGVIQHVPFLVSADVVTYQPLYIVEVTMRNAKVWDHQREKFADLPDNVLGTYSSKSTYHNIGGFGYRIALDFDKFLNGQWGTQYAGGVSRIDDKVVRKIREDNDFSDAVRMIDWFEREANEDIYDNPDVLVDEIWRSLKFLGGDFGDIIALYAAKYAILRVAYGQLFRMMM